MGWTAIDEQIDRRRLWRGLIDNARSDQAGLTDNELAALLMVLSGFNTVAIAAALENERGTGTISQTRAQQIVQSAFRKALKVGGIERKIDLMALRLQKSEEARATRR